MKLITAVIRPSHLEQVREELTKQGINAMTVTEVQGVGNQGGHNETYRGTEYKVSFIKKFQIQVAVADDKENAVVKTICDTAHTGKIGDGKIWVTDLTRMVRVRTGEEGDIAI